MPPFHNFTSKAQDAIRRAHELAIERGQNQIEPAHLLAALLLQDEGVVISILEKMEVDMALLTDSTLDAIDGGARANGVMPYPQIYLTPDLGRVLEEAHRSSVALKDDNISIEHLFLGLLGANSKAKEILGRFRIEKETVLRILSEVRGQLKVSEVDQEMKLTVLERYSKNLTRLARQGKLDPVIGREDEIRRIMQVLMRRTKNNPVLIGEAGVGKTAIVEGLARKIAEGDVPELLKEKELIALDLGSLVAGTKYRGEFEERLKSGIREIERDELHHGVKITDEAIQYAVILSARYITERFLPDKAVDLIDEAASALRLELDSMPDELDKAARHITKLEVEKEALARDADQRSKVKTRKVQKEIDELKEKTYGLELKWKNEKDTITRIRQIKKDLEVLRNEAEGAERKGELARVAEIRYGRIPELERQLLSEESRLKKLQTPRRFLKEEVTEEDIAAVVSRWTGIPVMRMLEAEAHKLSRIEDELKKRIVGQNEAITRIANAVRRSRAGISDEDRPIGSFIFLGPTGVGKTELAKALAEFMFNDEKSLIRVDMSEYMERHTVSKFIGSPPGYVGYEEGGQLTEMIRHRPYAVVLFDEIEKAHPE